MSCLADDPFHKYKTCFYRCGIYVNKKKRKTRKKKKKNAISVRNGVMRIYRQP